jgi:hypothetical protein
MEWSIIREADDKIAKTRISLGQAKQFNGSYLVFRGKPEDVIELLELALDKARVALPLGDYQDQRGRRQG